MLVASIRDLLIVWMAVFKNKARKTLTTKRDTIPPETVLKS